MALAHRSHGVVEVIVLPTRLSAAEAPVLRRELQAVVSGGGTRLLLDLSGVSFIDSSGLSVLVTALKAARGAGGDVALLKPTGTVRSLVELTRLHRVFSIFDDEAAAVREFAP